MAPKPAPSTCLQIKHQAAATEQRMLSSLIVSQQQYEMASTMPLLADKTSACAVILFDKNAAGVEQ